MFKRINYDDWITIVPIIAFLITFAFFIYVVVKAIRMKKPETDHLSSLPLEDEDSETSKHPRP